MKKKMKERRKEEPETNRTEKEYRYEAFEATGFNV
jgi:hypothetical protein